MELNQQTIQLFAATRDTCTPAMISALIDAADGYYLPDAGHQWLWWSLEKYGLMTFVTSGDDWPYQLTDYGRAFVKWLRQPRDLPTQMGLWDAD